MEAQKEDVEYLKMYYNLITMIIINAGLNSMI